jgi:hypothetical protein
MSAEPVMVKAILRWARDPKWWAVVLLAYALQVFFSDVRPSFATISQEHQAITASNAKVVENIGELGEILRRLVAIQNKSFNMSVQSCINQAGGNEGKIDRCWAIMNGEVPR